MRYLIDPEFRSPPVVRKERGGIGYSAALRQELSVRNLLWARSRGHEHEVSLGGVPAVLYRETDAGLHGNFLDASYRAIHHNPLWARRLHKVHTTARRVLLSRDSTRGELDSSNSSDALLMNIFCHPLTLRLPEICALLGIDGDAEAVFGYKPGVALSSGRRDTTEIDLRLGKLLIEAKLTETDFQVAPTRLVERYRYFQAVFDVDLLEVEAGCVRSYQLLRGILAAAADEESRFCVLCDARRPDLVDAWHRVMMAVTPYELRCRLQLLTWQELAGHLPAELQEFLYEKFGISATGAGSGRT